jgi:hypothetical protein
MPPRRVVTVTVRDVQKRLVPSKHYVYVIEVTWSDGSVLLIFRRYSALFDLHMKLLDDFPAEAGAVADGPERTLPYLPGRKLFGRSHTHKVAVSRVRLVEEYLRVLVAIPAVGAAPAVTAFLEPTPQDLRPLRSALSPGTTRAAASASSATAATSSTGVMVLEVYTAVADYKPSGRGELALRTGVTVEVVEKNDNGWWFVVAAADGSNHGSDGQGWVPATFLEPEDAAQDGELDVATRPPAGADAYVVTAAHKPGEPDELAVPLHAVVTVLEMHMDGWWKAVYAGATGWVPAVKLREAPPGAGAASAATLAAAIAAAGVASPAAARRAPTRRVRTMFCCVFFCFFCLLSITLTTNPGVNDAHEHACCRGCGDCCCCCCYFWWSEPAKGQARTPAAPENHCCINCEQSGCCS